MPVCRKFSSKIENRLGSEFQRYWWVSKPMLTLWLMLLNLLYILPGAAIFFEFKHYKPKKRFTSTKCFAFMEMDEIKPGPIVIELWVNWHVFCFFLSKWFEEFFCVLLEIWRIYVTFLNFRYKKPTDYKRKKLQLLTKKQLYLHLHQTLHKDS